MLIKHTLTLTGTPAKPTDAPFLSEMYQQFKSNTLQPVHCSKGLVRTVEERVQALKLGLGLLPRPLHSLPFTTGQVLSSFLHVLLVNILRRNL